MEDDPKRPDAGRVIERREIVNRNRGVVLAADRIQVVAARHAGKSASARGEARI